MNEHTLYFWRQSKAERCVALSWKLMPWQVMSLAWDAAIEDSVNHQRSQGLGNDFSDAVDDVLGCG